MSVLLLYYLQANKSIYFLRFHGSLSVFFPCPVGKLRNAVNTCGRKKTKRAAPGFGVRSHDGGLLKQIEGSPVSPWQRSRWLLWRPGWHAGHHHVLAHLLHPRELQRRQLTPRALSKGKRQQANAQQQAVGFGVSTGGETISITTAVPSPWIWI
jgi:hypothetical protein